MQPAHSEFLKKTLPVWSLRKNEGASTSFGLAQEVETDPCAGDEDLCRKCSVFRFLPCID